MRIITFCYIVLGSLLIGFAGYGEEEQTEIQEIIKEELKQMVSEYQPSKCGIIVQDSKPGKILAKVSYPDTSHWLFEPGTILNTFLFAGAIEEGIADSIDIDNFIKRSNVGALKLARKLEKERVYRYLKEFGFSLKAPEDWMALTLPNIAIGQSISVTGMQLINAFSVIANKGLMPGRDERVISEKTVERLIGVLKTAIQKGLEKEIPTTGKSGIAQIFDSDAKEYKPDKYLHSFCGFFPADNPQYTILVLIQEPIGIGKWDNPATKVFNRIMKSIGDIGK